MCVAVSLGFEAFLGHHLVRAKAFVRFNLIVSVLLASEDPFCKRGGDQAFSD